MDSPSLTLNEEPVTVEQGSPQVLLDGTPWHVEPAEWERKELQQAQEAARRKSVSTILCTTVSFTGEEKTFEVRASRSEVEYMLPTFRHLQAHLRASVGILAKYSDEEFGIPYLSPLFAADTAASPLTEQIGINQILFTHHHSAVSETLRESTERFHHTDFGLPDNYDWHVDRNSFCHDLLMPHVPFRWAERMKPMKKLHTGLLTQVEKTLRAMEERFDWGWPVKSDAPEEEYGEECGEEEEYGEGEEESGDRDFWEDQDYEVWDYPTMSDSEVMVDPTQDEETLFS
jgi:hypothetical protein